jgi:predicted site-specific integrase-resolvase
VSICSTGNPIRPLAYRVNTAAQILDISRSQTYNLMKSGQLEYVEAGKIRLVTDRGIRKLLKLEGPAA